MNYKQMIKDIRKQTLAPVNVEYNNAQFNKNTWYLFYHNYFINILSNFFEWKNLPDGIDPVYLENNLNSNGHLVFLKDEELGYLVQTGVKMDNLDLYGNPFLYQITNESGYFLKNNTVLLNNYIDDLDENKGILINNDNFSNPSYAWIDLFSRNLADIQQTIQIARNSMRVPYVFLTDEDTKLAVKNFYKSLENGEPVIYIKDRKNKDALTDDNLLDKLQIVNVGSSVNNGLLRELNDEKIRIFNEFLTFIGLKVSNKDKKERMLTGEINGDDGLIAANIETRLKARKKSVEMINKCFGLNIEVEISSSIEIHNLDMLDNELEELDDSLDDVNVDNLTNSEEEKES